MSSSYSLPANAVWFITGGSSGIGKAFATHVNSNKSYRLVAAARSLADLDYLPDGPNVLKTILDLASSESIHSAIANALARFGRLDAVVNNAGYTVLGDFEAFSDEQARGQLEINFWGAVALAREAVRAMREENPKTGQAGGVFCQMASVSGRVAFSGGAFYFARFAWEGFAESLSKELPSEWNIHLMTVQPAGVKTDYLKKSTGILERHPAYASSNSGANAMVSATKENWDLSKFGGPEQLVEVVGDVIREGINGRIPLRLPSGADGWILIDKALEKEQKTLQETRSTSFRMAPEDQRSPLEVFI